MKKRILLLSTLLLGLVSGQNFALSTDVEKGFLEGTVDTHNFTETKMIHKNIVIGDAETTLSKMFVQGTYIENTYYLRFSTAVKGDISSITYTRGAVGEQEEVSKNVSTLYKGIEADGETYFYSTEAGTEDNLTTDTSFAEQYYWACYTISIAKENYSKFSSLDLTMSLIVNEDETLHAEKTVNIGSILDEMTPVDIGTKYKTVNYYDLKDASSTMTYDQNNRGYYYNACNTYAKSDGVKVEWNKGIGSFGKGQYVVYEINADYDADALLVLSASKSSSSSFSIKNIVSITYGYSADSLTRSVDTGDRNFTPRNSWTRYSQISAGEIHLKKGKNYIRLDSLESFNYSHIALVRPYNQTLDQVETVEFGLKYPSFVKEDLKDGTGTDENKVMQFSNDAVGYYYEAENTLTTKISSGSDITYSTKETLSGGKAIQSLKYATKLLYTINSTVDTDVMLNVCGAIWDSIKYEDAIRVNYGTTEALGNTMTHYLQDKKFGGGSWDKYLTYNIGELHLSQGMNYLEIEVLEPVNYDYFALIRPLPEPEVDSLATYGALEKEALVDGQVSNGISNVKVTSLESGYYYEAENAQITGTTKTTTKNNKTYVESFNGSDDVMTFTVEANENLNMGLILNSTRWNDGAMDDIFVASYGNDLNNLEVVNTQGRRIKGASAWDSKFASYNVGEVKLKPGINYIQIVGVKDGINIDYMALINAKEPMESTYDYDTSVVKNDLSNGTETMTFDLNGGKGYYYEAENATLSSGINIENTASASNGKNIGSFNSDKKMTFTINSSVETNVLVVLSLTRYNDGNLLMNNAFSVKYGVDGILNHQINTYDSTIPNHGSWSAFREYSIGELHLQKGENTIVFTALQSTNVDYMCLVSPIAK